MPKRRSLEVLLRHWMCRVVLLNQIQYVNYQLGAGLPRIPGRGITAQPDEVTSPTSVHMAVIQQQLKQIALATRVSPKVSLNA
uniref:Uncharacterized protein n=1 Tax=Peronospora matthiolae TaxID=2874970 RepID=A0AAV1UWP0_9STRA